jgi:RNA polymerase sigma-70 factor (ECF subfamily)
MYTAVAAATQRSASPTRPRASLQFADADDVTLLEGLVADDERAWREFNTRYSRLIYRCITRVTARFSAVVSAEDVREIYAMLCVGLLANDKRKLRSFEPGRGNKLGSWLGMLAIHTAYDHLRQVKREPRRASLSEAEQLTSTTEDPAEACELRERARLVSETLKDFSAKDRQFVALYFGDGLDPEEVARRMRISVKTVYSKKHKIQSRLESLLAQRQIAA